MNIRESLAQLEGRKGLETRLEGSLGKRGGLVQGKEATDRMAVDLIELRTRDVSTDFVVSRGRKLVYVGEPGLVSEGFGQLADRCGETQHLDLSFQKLLRQDLGRISRMSNLHTLVLDNCQLSEKVLGFLGNLPSVSTVSLNNNLITSLRPAIQILCKSFPKLAILSLIGNPFHKSLQAPVQVLHYRLEVIYRVPKLRILDHAAVSKEERRQAERGKVANSGNSRGAIFGSGRVLPRETTKAVEELGERGDKGGGGEGDGLITERQPGWSSNSYEQVRGKQRTPSRAKAKQEGTEEALEATEKERGDQSTVLTTSKTKPQGIKSEGNRFIQNCEL